jgi:hypothetical protein
MPGKMEPRPKPGVYSTGRCLLFFPLLRVDARASSSDDPTLFQTNNIYNDVKSDETSNSQIILANFTS